jgi:hypothetical protein
MRDANAKVVAASSRGCSVARLQPSSGARGHVNRGSGKSRLATCQVPHIADTLHRRRRSLRGTNRPTEPLVATTDVTTRCPALGRVSSCSMPDVRLAGGSRSSCTMEGSRSEDNRNSRLQYVTAGQLPLPTGTIGVYHWGRCIGVEVYCGGVRACDRATQWESEHEGTLRTVRDLQSVG